MSSGVRLLAAKVCLSSRAWARPFGSLLSPPSSSAVVYLHLQSHAANPFLSSAPALSNRPPESLFLQVCFCLRLWSTPLFQPRTKIKRNKARCLLLLLFFRDSTYTKRHTPHMTDQAVTLVGKNEKRNINFRVLLSNLTRNPKRESLFLLSKSETSSAVSSCSNPNPL